MTGIIYKFTIVAKLKMDGHRPFYVGQHWCNNENIEYFLKQNSYNYSGSGKIWGDFIKKLKEMWNRKYHEEGFVNPKKGKR